jgi:beta-lactamase regulating signal transducer with metallopeptidase domain
MGDHPCPRCLVPLSDIHKLGTPEDLTMRRENRRKDDVDRKDKVNKARRIILVQNYSVNTPEVEKLLKPTSLVPAQVSRALARVYSNVLPSVN